MNGKQAEEHFFNSKLFSKVQATPEQLKQYALVLWPIQVGLIVSLPVLCGTLCKEIGTQALVGDNFNEEKRLKIILRNMFPPTIDELGHDRDRYSCMHHDLFAGQVKACTGLSHENLRQQWIRGEANQALANFISESVLTISEGLHMMYVVETLAPKFFLHQEKIFLSCSKPEHVFHSTMHKETELKHADEAEQFFKHVVVDDELIAKNFLLWRGVADQIYKAMNY